ncbi:hypothetical protein [Nitrospira sp. BLG_2]|uniref:hypothetical protein n=1 Tax=Nitrospira sp. BLG_2 TaxID=3397507 RepID=UPI003B9B0FB7
MYTKQQILTEVQAYQANTIFDSDIVDDWFDMATQWLTDDPSEYLKDGFDGFNDRSPEQILCDFYLAGKVADMSESEFNAIMDK